MCNMQEFNIYHKINAYKSLTNHTLPNHTHSKPFLLQLLLTLTKGQSFLTPQPTWLLATKRKKIYTLAWKWKSLSRVQLLVTPWTIQCKEFSRPEYWSIPVFQKPFPSPGDLPNPRIEPRSPTLQVDSLPAEPQGKPIPWQKPSLFLWMPILD